MCDAREYLHTELSALIVFVVMADHTFLKLVRGKSTFGFKRTTLQKALTFLTVLKLFWFELKEL